MSFSIIHKMSAEALRSPSFIGNLVRKRFFGDGKMSCDEARDWQDPGVRNEVQNNVVPGKSRRCSVSASTVRVG